MVTKKRYPYEPDYAVASGETLAETLESLGMSQAELAKRTGRTVKLISEIINGKAPITPDTALQLERVLGVPASFWNNLERNYREQLALLHEQQRLKEQIEWLQRFPISAMCKLGWIKHCKNSVEQLRELLNFFGIADIDAWERIWGTPNVAYRRSKAYTTRPEAVSAWLRRGEIIGGDIVCDRYDAEGFRRALADIRQLIVELPETFVPAVIERCSAVGVAVAFVHELPQCRVSGATRWLNPEKALVQLSLRYRTDDHLWFSFFHEAGHILKHGKREVFIEVNDATDQKLDAREEEANRFAADLLIPPKEYKRLVSGVGLDRMSVQRFAAELGITPGIIVGRLQHDQEIPYNSPLNSLKRRFTWA